MNVFNRSKLFPPIGVFFKLIIEKAKSIYKPMLGLFTLVLTGASVLIAFFYKFIYLAGALPTHIGVLITGFILVLAYIILYFYCYTGMSILGFTSQHDNNSSIRSVLSSSHSKVALFILLTIVLQLVVSGGTLLLVIPGIIFTLMFSLAIPLLLDNRYEKFCIKSLFSASKTLMSGIKLDVLFYSLLAGITVFLLSILVLVLFVVLGFSLNALLGTSMPLLIIGIPAMIAILFFIILLLYSTSGVLYTIILSERKDLPEKKVSTLFLIVFIILGLVYTVLTSIPRNGDDLGGNQPYEMEYNDDGEMPTEEELQDLWNIVPESIGQTEPTDVPDDISI